MIFFHDKSLLIHHSQTPPDASLLLSAGDPDLSALLNRVGSPTPSAATGISSELGGGRGEPKKEFEFLLFSYLLRFVHRESPIGEFSRAGILFLIGESRIFVRLVSRAPADRLLSFFFASCRRRLLSRRRSIAGGSSRRHQTSPRRVYARRRLLRGPGSVFRSRLLSSSNEARRSNGSQGRPSLRRRNGSGRIRSRGNGRRSRFSFRIVVVRRSRTFDESNVPRSSRHLPQVPRIHPGRRQARIIQIVVPSTGYSRSRFSRRSGIRRSSHVASDRWLRQVNFP